MSIFDRKFKLDTGFKEKTISLLESSINNKLTSKEVARIYDIIHTNAMSLATDEERIKEGVKILTELKENWLTPEEKQTFVSGVWFSEFGFDKTNTKNISFINPNELEYTKKAVLGSIFKNIE